LTSTGRLAAPVKPAVQEILLGGSLDMDDRATVAELRLSTAVDLAHAVMLIESGIVDAGSGRSLLRGIRELRATDFAALHGRDAPRGVYLAYERLLRDQLGDDVGGILHTGRSRNDLNATVLRLRLREPYVRLLRETLRLGACLVRQARRRERVVMPAYTHYQVAVPITYGHYLAGAALALARDFDFLAEAGRELDHCPLGAGAGGGTTIPIDPARTARLLGFEWPVSNSLDAVASRDVVLRLLAATAIMAILLSRIAHDLLLWSTAEFGFLLLPDDLVGSSSMMPQKRNPFLLEHVQGRTGALVGSFVEAAVAMQGTPFTNTPAVSVEAVRAMCPALERGAESATLLRFVVAGAEIDGAALERRTEDGYACATALAERLVESGTPFRAAHEEVGALVASAVEANQEPLEVAARNRLNTQVPLERLDPSSVAAAASFGGGPGSAADSIAAAHEAWSTAARRLRALERRWSDVEQRLDAVAAAAAEDRVR
jgi:argininosuccinate lyase